jgi:demethylmenaquinone methyltransferase / 2-methoxy-6-polyprenyl-1,4-benzoquinol methylase
VTTDVAASRAKPNAFARQLFAGLPRRYNLLAAILSLGQDGRWRDEMVRHVVDARPNRVLDVACGPAAVTCSLAERTHADLVGIDLSRDMLGEGAANVERGGFSPRVSLVLGRGEQLPFDDDSFDALTFTYLLRYVDDPEATLRELARVVKPRGTVAGLEFGVPDGIWRPAWEAWVLAGLPAAGRVIGGGWDEVGTFLGPSIREHYERWPLTTLVSFWREAGIENVSYRRLSLGGGIVTWGRRRS